MKMTVKEAARALSVSETTIRNRVEAGTLRKRGILVTIPDNTFADGGAPVASIEHHKGPIGFLAAARLVQAALRGSNMDLVTIHKDRVTVQFDDEV